MEYNEQDFLMLSGIQHFAFCRKQWALIHIDMVWEENLLTTSGEIMHEKCHDSMSAESRKDIIISRGMPIFSRTLGVSGECDVVEFKRCINGITLAGREGIFKVCPVEYKHGSPKETDEDIMQLVAQAMCLEEMLMCDIDEGAIFYGQTKRRIKVAITEELKDKVRKMLCEMHQYVQSGYVPQVKASKKCNSCSLKNECMPKLAKLSLASKYLAENLGQQEDD